MKKFLTVFVALLVLVLLAEVGFLIYLNLDRDEQVPTTVATEATTQAPTQPAETTVPTTAPAEATTLATEETTVPTTAATEAPTEMPTEVPTEAPTEAPTEPTDGSTTYLLSFAGSCTLGTTLSDAKNSAGFHSIIGEDYGFPFRNVQEYFANDDFTMVNLEGVLADGGDPIGKKYTFIGPSAYTNILTQGSVEAVSLANDHTGDFGSQGYDSTKANLDTAGVAYVEDDDSLLYTTDSGLKIGVYAVNGTLSNWDMQQEIKSLKRKGAEVIVVYFHWSEETAYEPGTREQNYGHAAIDAGADLVIGTHPHVLQKIESYRDGIICYSLGNFSYGGAKWPKDMDTAIVQLEVIRDADGKIAIGELFIIPCTMTSSDSQNNYQPTPVEDTTGWQYKQILRKLSDPEKGTATETKPAETKPAEAPTEAPTEATQPTQSGSTDIPDLYDPEA